MLVAEEVLRTRYGDDFKGCTVNPETVARIIRVAIDQRAAKDQALLDVYEKVVQGIDLLSTPREASRVTDLGVLRSVLGERLDAIHAITTQTIGTTGELKS